MTLGTLEAHGFRKVIYLPHLRFFWWKTIWRVHFPLFPKQWNFLITGVWYRKQQRNEGLISSCSFLKAFDIILYVCNHPLLLDPFLLLPWLYSSPHESTSCLYITQGKHTVLLNVMHSHLLITDPTLINWSVLNVELKRGESKFVNKRFYTSS